PDAVAVTGSYVSTTATPPTASAAGSTTFPSTISHPRTLHSFPTRRSSDLTLYTWYKDAAGNVSTIAAASILLDQTAPSNGSAAADPNSTHLNSSHASFTYAGSGLATNNPYKLFSSTIDFPASCTGTPLFSG